MSEETIIPITQLPSFLRPHSLRVHNCYGQHGGGGRWLSFSFRREVATRSAGSWQQEKGFDPPSDSVQWLITGGLRGPFYSTQTSLWTSLAAEGLPLSHDSLGFFLLNPFPTLTWQHLFSCAVWRPSLSMLLLHRGNLVNAQHFLLS